MDGCELARHLRGLPGMGKCLLVAITGYGHESEARRCKQACIDRHFVKPVDPAQLQQMLSRELGRDRPGK